ncbi:MAG: dipeptidase, partial [Trueperaceae bacterium]
PVFDGHNDLLTAMHWPERSGPRDPLHRNAGGHLDLPRMREGGMLGGFFSAFVPSQVAPNDFAASTDAHGRYRLPTGAPLEARQARTHVAAMMDAAHELAAASDGTARIVTEPEAARTAMREGVIAIALHLEGAEAIAPDLSDLDELLQAGVRSIAPAWSRDNAFAHGVPLAHPSSPDLAPGLTDAGRELVRACDARGILIDVSHLPETGFWDVLDATNGPVIASHSNAHAVCAHSRNLTDRQLDALAERDGVVGLNFGAGFLAPDGAWDEELPVSVLVRHLDHLASRLGESGVALGSDFDGARLPRCVGDATRMQAPLRAVRDAGWSRAAIEALASENWLRVWSRARVRKVAG